VAATISTGMGELKTPKTLTKPVQSEVDCANLYLAARLLWGGCSLSWSGDEFLIKGLGRVKTEMSLYVLAYYVKRLMNVKAYATPGDG
jgi:hypothetical protein